MLAGVWAVAAAPGAQVEVVSVAEPVLVPSGGNGNSGGPQLSAGGDLLLFLSQASNLTTNDAAHSPTGAFTDLYVKNLRSGQLTLVSATPDGRSGGNDASGPGLISDDGRYVIFQSDASNLVSNDLNGLSDIFVRNLTNERTTLVSVDEAGQQSAAGSSRLLTATPDGRSIVFESTASNLVSAALSGPYNYFVRDTVTGVTRPIPVPFESADIERAAEAAITPDGRFVAVTALRKLVLTDATNFTQELYLADMVSNQVVWVSSNAPAFTGRPTTNELLQTFLLGPQSYAPALSADGRFVAFKTVVSSNSFLFRYDAQTAQLLVVTSNLVDRLGGDLDNSLDLAMTGDGRFILYDTLTADGTQAQIYLWDADAGTTTLVTAAADGAAPAAGISDNARMTPDARYVVFSSDATNLVSGGSATLDQPFPRRVYWRDLTTRRTQLISFDSTAAQGRGGDAINPDISNNGQIVAFEAWDPDLVSSANNVAQDVFVRIIGSPTITLVSERNRLEAAVTPNGFSSLAPNSVSSNGQFVVFTSVASNISSNDQNNALDVFVRDLASRSNILVSAISGSFPARAGNSNSFSPVISATGRYVAFSSFSSDLVSNDLNGSSDIFLRDLVTGELRLVSVNSAGTLSANNKSQAPSISADGRFIAFESLATDLVPGADTLSGSSQAFVHDALLKTNVLVSINLNGQPTRGLQPVISPDGHLVLFRESTITPLFFRNLVTESTIRLPPLNPFDFRFPTYSFSRNGHWVLFEGDAFSSNNSVRRHEIHLYHVEADSYLRVCIECEQASISDDGSYIAYLRSAPDLPDVLRAVWVYDRVRDRHFPASLSFDGTGSANGQSEAPSITADGRYVVFQSKATNLSPFDTNSFGDIYIRDISAGTTLLASRTLRADSPGSVSSHPIIGYDGRTLFFQSGSDNLVPGDQNQLTDIFIYRISSEDSDNDGLPDSWEVTYFRDLSHDGSADSDGDGQSDLAEFRAGTQPLQAASAFRWHPVQLNGLDVILSWSAVPGKHYRLQFKNNLSDPFWQNSTTVTADGFVVALKEGSEQASQRFYRVLIDP